MTAVGLGRRLRAVEKQLGEPDDPWDDNWLWGTGIFQARDWLDRHGYAGLLEAWQDGHRGPLLEHEAVRQWCQQAVGADCPALAVALRREPPEGLRGLLRSLAVGNCFRLALHRCEGFRYVGRDRDSWALVQVLRLLKVPPHDGNFWQDYGRLRQHIGQRPIPPPDDNLLTLGLRLVVRVYEGEDVPEEFRLNSEGLTP
jgi:hypothetical protein